MAWPKSGQGSSELSTLNQILFRVPFLHSLITIYNCLIGSDPRPGILVILLDDFIHCTIGRRPLERCAKEEDVDEDQAEGEAAEKTSIFRMILWFDQ